MKIARDDNIFDNFNNKEPEDGHSWVGYFKRNKDNSVEEFISEKIILHHFIKKNLIDYCLEE